nr:hypothetical protein CFP56_67806 [Quercus suber]
MAPLNIYDITVPMLMRHLESLRAVLAKGSEWATKEGKNETELVEKRLVPDMLPLAFQVQTCCNVSVKLLARVGDIETPSIPDNETTFLEFDARIAKTLEILKNAKPADFEGKEHKEISFKAGPAMLHFDGMGYVQEFCLPNFFFHKTMAYALLRQAGVSIGKFDFLGKPTKGMEMES